MPRPRQIEDETVLEAVGQALHVFGLEALRLREVAGLAGTSAATLVQRFGSKRALLLAYARNLARQLDEALVPSGASLDADLTKLTGALESFEHTPEAFASRLSFVDASSENAVFSDLADASSRRMRAFLRSMVDGAVARGELESRDPERLARTLHLTINGAFSTRRSRAAGTDASTLAEDLNAVIAPYRRAAPGVSDRRAAPGVSDRRSPPEKTTRARRAR